MANEFLDDHEQGERVRTWLRNNFGAVLIGLAGGVALIWGYGKYQDWSVVARDRAGNDYGRYLAAVEKKDADEVKKIGAELRDKYKKSPYAVLTAMNEAEQALAEGGKQAEAIASLRWALNNATSDELKDLTSLRLARALIDSGALDEALLVVDAIKSTGFGGPVAELRGDILLAQGKAADAKAAYEQALAQFDAVSARRRFVEMKRDDIGLPAAATTKAGS